MNLNHVIESWRDEEYRESLNDETRSLLPESPAGEVELSEADLASVDGGTTVTISVSWSYSWTHTWDAYTNNDGTCDVAVVGPS
jgi:mersacidin/lichenicidin family type 2 lantibiotic